MLLSLSDTYQRATQNPFVKEAMREFCMDLGEKTKVWEERGRK
jgi:hypothetical protein